MEKWWPKKGRIARWDAIFKIEVFDALQQQFGPSKCTSLKTTLQNTTPI